MLSPAVALVQMPFGMACWPALGLSLLKAALVERKISTEVFYFNIDFLGTLGSERYQSLASGSPHSSDLLCEWIFCEAALGKDAHRDQVYAEQFSQGFGEWTDKGRQEERLQYWSLALAARAAVPLFLQNCLSGTDWNGVRIVGFTSTFQQHLASLALAKLLKAAYPHLFVIFGGANCESEMGRATLKSFEYIDAVCSGEADHAFPDFASGFLKGATPPPIPGIMLQQHKSMSLPLIVQGQGWDHTPMVEELDSLPIPDFDDFFHRWFRFSKKPPIALRLMIETSRGCWWGQKHHCTFCGLNGHGMRFRSKSPDRALSELTRLIQIYGRYVKGVSAADNIIPFEYFDTLLPALERLNIDIDIFYETKANLTEQHVAQYKRAGLNQIQPGIESLVSSVLRRMEKGVTALQNIQLLVWCAKYNVVPLWNYLVGFPGETTEEYSGQTVLFTKLRHLRPPSGVNIIRFDRFSPYHRAPQEFGIRQITPYPAYKYVYSGLDERTQSDLAYYFTGEYDGRERLSEYLPSLRSAVDEWRRQHANTALVHIPTSNGLLILDARVKGSLSISLLRGVYEKVLLRCSQIVSLRSLQHALQQDGYSLSAANMAIERLIDNSFLIEEAHRVLSISVSLGSGYSLPSSIMNKFLETVGLDRPDPFEDNDAEITFSRDICTVFE